jgi:GNAT superfamily N-acetyltransferase
VVGLHRVNPKELALLLPWFVEIVPFGDVGFRLPFRHGDLLLPSWFQGLYLKPLVGEDGGVERTTEGLIRLGKGDIPQAAEVLASAFQDDPLLRYASPDRARRKKLARHFCRISLYYAVRYGEVYAPREDLPGVAAWLPSAQFPLTGGEVLRSVPLRDLLGLTGRVGLAGGVRLQAVDACLKALHARVAPFPHLFLFILGVAPQHQGQGYAGRLLRPVLARLDREGLPCYVDTLQRRNVPLYEHFGFRVVEEYPVPGTELTAWAMLREPAGGSSSTGRRG